MKFSAAEIFKLRDRLGLTQAELAQELGVVAGAVAHWEGGRASPRKKTRRKLEALASEPPGSPDARSHKPRSRHSEVFRVQMHAALNAALDNAPDTVVDKITEILEKFAGQHGSPPEKPSKKASLPGPPKE